MMKNAINWFEIPSSDFERAKKFYSEILSAELFDADMPGIDMAFLPSSQEEGAVGGAIIKTEWTGPSDSGTMVYLNGGEDLSPILARVEAAGGKVVMEKTEIGNNNGFMAVFTDTEGNRVGLHSMN